MKYLKKTFLIAVALIILGFFSCEKVPFNYRNDYVGDWQFIVSNSSFSMADSTSSYEEHEYAGEIKYGDADNELEVHYGDNMFYTIQVDKENGVISSPIPNFSGEFEGSSSIAIRTSWGGMGGGGSSKVEGVKQ